MNQPFNLASRIAATASFVIAATGCVTMPAVSTREYPDYSANRTPINNAPTNCRIITHEQGAVRGGTAVFNEGVARRDCVTTTDPRQQRNANVEAMRDARRTVQEADMLGRSILNIQRTIRSLGR